MDTQRWHQVKALFEDAAGRSEPERADFLARACGADADLRHEVDALLAAHDDDTPFLETPLVAEAWALLSQPASLPEGTRLGPYRLLREIGQGGMGLVYLAERADGQFERQVAIKLVRLAGARRDLVHRFEQERRLLASLDHPGIARLLDGGVTDPLPGAPDGLPYLVMEVVEGEPITAYADRHQLTTRARVALFRAVCEAVQYAHQNLIVHRDLKPSNILVTPDGTVKLLDFGIAKLLDTDPDATLERTGFRAMTPTYAAPEQIRGEAITTATDVYALGVLLYELLTGHRPYAVHDLSPSGVEAVICETVPTRPSSVVVQPTEQDDPVSAALRHSATPDGLRRRLRGDLDTIVMKALRKDPARRYPFAASLDEDLRRYLGRLPVRARPDTLGYRASRFIRRHAVGVAATALVLLVLLGGIVATTRQARIAEARFDDLRTLSNTLLSDVHDGIRDLPGATPARRTLVANALAYLDGLYQEGSADPALQFDLAAAYEQIGEIQGDPHYTNLGDLEGALESYRKAFELRAALWERDSTDDRVRQALANSYGNLSTVIGWRGGPEDVQAMRLRALALLAPLAARTPPDPSVLHDLARIQSERGWGLIFDGAYDTGIAETAAAIAILERLVQDDLNTLGVRPGPALARALHLWRAYSYQADGHSFSGQSEALLALMETQGLPLLHRLEQTYPNHPRVQYGLHVGYGYLGLAQTRLGGRTAEEAPASYRMALAYAEAMVRMDSTNQKGQEALSRSLVALAGVEDRQGHTDAAVTTYERALALARQTYDADPDNAEAGNKVAIILRYLCRTLAGADRLDEALPWCTQSIQVQEAVVARNASSVYRGNLGSAYGHTARIHRTLALRAPDGPGRQSHRTQALHWYRLGVQTLAATKADKSAEDLAGLAWEVNPDSLAAEYAAFRDGE